MKNLLHATDKNLDYDKVENQLVSRIRDYVTKANLTSCIVGVSGGIDSAVVSTLAAKTGLPTILLTMPIHQNANEVDRANEHIQWLQSQYQNVLHQNFDLTIPYEDMKDTLLQGGYTEEKLYMTLVNTRSRLRMAMLYAVAGSENGIVVGTGNKVEDFGIGFFTKYGDGGVDISPIGDLLKSEVRKLAGHLGIVPSIQQVQPTDGLHPDGKTDEDQIKASYDELERAMEQFENHLETSATQGMISGYDTIGPWKENYNSRAREVIDIFLTRHNANRHKMSMPPIPRIQ